MTPTTTEPRDAYEAWHSRLDAAREAAAPWHRLVKKHLVPERDLSGRAILEIGCGRGELSAWLAGHEARPERVVGADFATTAVALGRREERRRPSRPPAKRVDWQVADIQQIAHPDATFDTVISCETLEHLPEPPRALAELARVLKPGGRLFLTTPNYLGLMGLFRIYRRLVRRPYTEAGQPINRFMLLPRTRSWITASGLEVEGVDGVGQYLPIRGREPIELPRIDRLPGARWLALHSIVVATRPPGERPRKRV